MPIITVKIPQGAYPGPCRADLVAHLNATAARVEQIPADPRNRFFCWVLIEEIAPGAWTCGGADVCAQLLPCLAWVHVPEGVLDGAARARFVSGVHEAFQAALPAAESRRLATSIHITDVAEGTWGANGAIWRLPQFAAAAGFAHLQGLAATASGAGV